MKHMQPTQQSVCQLLRAAALLLFVTEADLWQLLGAAVTEAGAPTTPLPTRLAAPQASKARLAAMQCLAQPQMAAAHHAMQENQHTTSAVQQT
jgi:hypothetical protein